MDDYVGYLKAPVGTWDGKTYRISIDGDCHTFAYRTDYLPTTAITAAEPRHDQGPTDTWQQVQAIPKAWRARTIR